MLPPDVNTSQIDFAVVEGKIRFGLNAVKNVGESACRAIVRAREEGGPFESIWDFTERVDPQVSNKRALESLVKAGALDSTGASRKGMLECLEQALSWGQKQQADKLLGQGSIFDLGDAAGDDGAAPPSGHPAEEFEKGELLHMEKESLGLYVSEHPLSGIRDQLRRKTDCTLVGARAAPRRRDRRRRRNRLRDQAADDEEGRADGLRRARGRHRRRSRSSRSTPSTRTRAS